MKENNCFGVVHHIANGISCNFKDKLMDFNFNFTLTLLDFNFLIKDEHININTRQFFKHRYVHALAK